MGFYGGGEHLGRSSSVGAMRRGEVSYSGYRDRLNIGGYQGAGSFGSSRYGNDYGSSYYGYDGRSSSLGAVRRRRECIDVENRMLSGGIERCGGGFRAKSGMVLPRYSLALQ